MNEVYKCNVPFTIPLFQFGPIFIPHFIHNHNVNHPPYRMTERSIELAVADLFLDKYNREQVAEIGAVTPYYWPHRVPKVIDPSDKHRLVTHRNEWQNVNIDVEAILSISTFEHIGLKDYGLKEDANKSRLAIDKLLKHSGDFLVTWSGGYNKTLDEYAKWLASDDAYNLYVWQRNQVGNDWIWSDWRELDFSSFTYGPFWGNALIIIHRGPTLCG